MSLAASDLRRRRCSRRFFSAQSSFFCRSFAAAAAAAIDAAAAAALAVSDKKIGGLICCAVGWIGKETRFIVGLLNSEEAEMKWNISTPLIQVIQQEKTNLCKYYRFGR